MMEVRRRGTDIDEDVGEPFVWVGVVGILPSGPGSVLSRVIEYWLNSC